jgi:hypothetical protein
MQRTIADGRRLTVYDTGSPNQRLNIDRLRGPKERELQRHSERDQCVDAARRFGLVELAPTGGVTCDDGVGGAPLENRVGAMAQLPLDNQTLDNINRRRHVFDSQNGA